MSANMSSGPQQRPGAPPKSPALPAPKRPFAPPRVAQTQKPPVR